MQINQPANKTEINEGELSLLITSIEKLDKLFEHEETAKRYLTQNGWLNAAGVQLLQARWSPLALCFMLLKTGLSSLPKTLEVVKQINDRTHLFGCTIAVRDTDFGAFFIIEGRNFYWFGE